MEREKCGTTHPDRICNRAGELVDELDRFFPGNCGVGRNQYQRHDAIRTDGAIKKQTFQLGFFGLEPPFLFLHPPGLL